MQQPRNADQPLPRRRDVLAGLSALVALPAATRAQAAPAEAPVTAGKLLADLAARRVSSRELTEAAIARIEALDGKINAVVVRDFARARDAADQADAAIAGGAKGALLGLPMTVKEQYDVAGLPTTWGIEAKRDYRPGEDAVAVQRLKAAGAIILGKTNVPAALSDWQSYNPIYGTTNNPWDLSRSPGGSSGGSAAALAAGFTTLELGSDIGGSLRAPAAFCGVYSHKPSLNLVPTRGSNYPGAPAKYAPDDMVVAGPLARSAADLQLALDVLAGPDPLWAGVGYKLDLPAPRHERLADYRVLVLDTHPLCPTAASVKDAVEGLATRLAALGCRVTRPSAATPNLAVTTRVYVELLAAFFSTDGKPEDHVRIQTLAAELAPDNLSLPAAWLRGATMSHIAWMKTGWLRESLRVRWSALLRDIDVILCPAMPTLAFPHDHSPDINTRRLTIDGRAVNYGDQVAWAGLATINGFPATTAPIGVSDTGLPLAIQIVGGYLQDRTTIGFAELLAREFGGFAPPPGY